MMEENIIKPKIATLVFMDLESTGLPSDVGRKNVHITEMSLIAIDRNTFEEDKNLRVLNKINLCIRPRSTITPGSMNITGLYNDILENQELFDDSIPKLLEYFFRRLQKPICLLAHNGNRFDFPVLQAELNRLNYTLGSDIVCADTLVAFRSICKSHQQTEALECQKMAEGKKKIKQIKTKKTVISDEEIENLLSEDLESFACIDTELPSEASKVLEDRITEILPSENESRIEAIKKENYVIGNEFLPRILNEQTPERCKVPTNTNEDINVRKRKTLDSKYNEYTDYKKRTLPTTKNLHARRTLFPESNPSSLEIHKITKFSLQYLYNYFFHENPPNSHYAEIDTISLSKVCQKINKDFLQWIDENYLQFSDINALW